MGEFAGRRVVVTGAASGIGRAIAVLLAEAGASLALIDRDAEPLAQVAGSTGGVAIAADLLDIDVIPSLITRASDALGGLDGLVNAAAVAYSSPIESLSHADWDRVVTINLTAPYALCRAATPFLRASAGATVVNIASGAALLPDKPNGTVYAASKGGLISFSKALASELAPQVRVNVVCPGLTDTPMVERLKAGRTALADSPEVQRYALKRPARPEEIAAAVVFLSGPKSSFMTGSTMVVDGGRVFH